MADAERRGKIRQRLQRRVAFPALKVADVLLTHVREFSHFLLRKAAGGP